MEKEILYKVYVFYWEKTSKKRVYSIHSSPLEAKLFFDSNYGKGDVFLSKEIDDKTPYELWVSEDNYKKVIASEKNNKTFFTEKFQVSDIKKINF